MSNSLTTSSSNIIPGKGSLGDNIVTISPCSSVDMIATPIVSEPMNNPIQDKNVELIFMKVREQLQNLGGRSVLKLYTMLNLERLLRETSSEKNSENMLSDPNDVIDENNVTNVTSINNSKAYNNNVESNNNSNVVIPLEASRTINSSFVGVVSSCASSLGIPQSKSTSVTSKIFTNEILQDSSVQPSRRGSMITPPTKISNDLNSFVKLNERRYSHSRPRTNSLCIDTTIYKNNKIAFQSTNIQNIESNKSIEVCPLNDKEIKSNSKTADEGSTVNTTLTSSTPTKDIYNDNISVNYDELVDGCTRVGLSLTPQEYETMFKSVKNKNSMVGIHRFILRIGGGLSVKRLELVQNTFKMLINDDSPNNAFILLKDAKAKFSPNEHPRVKSGELTPEQVLYRFLFFFESDRPDGVIELIEWEYYYATISAEISQDSFFEKQMVQCWPGLQLYDKYSTTPKLNSKRRREIAEQLNIMNYVTNNYRVFRDLLDIAFIECNQDGLHHLEKNEVYEILRHFYQLIHQPFDETIFDELWIRMYRELEDVVTISDYEEQLYNAIKKEITYMEYEIFVHVADDEN